MLHRWKPPTLLFSCQHSCFSCSLSLAVFCAPTFVSARLFHALYSSTYTVPKYTMKFNYFCLILPTNISSIIFAVSIHGIPVLQYTRSLTQKSDGSHALHIPKHCAQPIQTSMQLTVSTNLQRSSYYFFLIATIPFSQTAS